MKLGTLLRITDINESDCKFRELAELGFTSCQLVYKPDEYTFKAAKIIKDTAHANGIEISAQFCGYKDNHSVFDNYYGFKTSGLNIEAYRFDRLEYVKKAASFAHEAGITDIVIHAGFIPNNPFANEYALMIAAIEHLCAHCASMNMNVLLETGGEAAVALLRLICDIGRDNLFVNLDPANMLMYGYSNPVDAMYTIGKYVRNIHGKDGVPPTDPRKLGDEKPIGEGMVDFYKLFEILRDLGYDRYITIERETSGEEQKADIIKAKKYFETMLSKLYN